MTTHVEWQEQVIDLGRYTGWSHLHVRRTRGRGGVWTTSTNLTGWPDLWLWNERRGGFAGVELKVGKDVPTQTQLDVLVGLARAGAATCVAYPADLERLQAMFTRPGDVGWLYDGRVKT